MVTWQAARNGLPGDANAVDKSAQINQLLAAHGVTPIYAGNKIVTPNGTGVVPNYLLSTVNYDQPFTMSGTAIGRVQVPVTPVGNGADLVVGLYTNNAGVPGTLLASTRVPAKWIASIASTTALPTTASYSPVGGMPGTGPLMTGAYNVQRFGAWRVVPWSPPSSSASGALASASWCLGGNYLILVGGNDSVSNAPLANVWTVNCSGGVAGTMTPQPSLPVGLAGAAVVATSDTLVAAGGAISGNPGVATVYTAGWNPTTGQVSAWTAQAALPAGGQSASAAVWNETVYKIGGFNAAGTSPVNSVYYATVQNGQISQWVAGPPLPLATYFPLVGVVGNILVVVAGWQALSNNTSPTWYAYINSDGSIGNWQTGPTAPIAIDTGNANSAGLVSIGGYTTSFTPTNDVETLTVTPNGLGSWQHQTIPGTTPNGDVAFVLPSGAGESQTFLFLANSYSTATCYTIPYLSVPLPVAGLSNGTTYHLVLSQRGGDNNNYLKTWLEAAALPLAVAEQPSGGGSWTSVPGYAVPITVFDQTAGGQVLHTWEDNGARITTLAYASTPDARLLGLLEATQFADGTALADAAAINYPGAWPAGAWPPQGVTQL